MTDDTLERMAREAGLHQDGDSWYSTGPGKYDEADAYAAEAVRVALAEASPVE